MKVKFVGDSPVEVPELGQGVVVDPGQTIDVPDDIGARMAESALWETSKRKPAAAGGEE